MIQNSSSGHFLDIVRFFSPSCGQNVIDVAMRRVSLKCEERISFLQFPGNCAGFETRTCRGVFAFWWHYHLFTGTEQIQDLSPKSVESSYPFFARTNGINPVSVKFLWMRFLSDACLGFFLCSKFWQLRIFSHKPYQVTHQTGGWSEYILFTFFALWNS